MSSTERKKQHKNFLLNLVPNEQSYLVINQLIRPNISLLKIDKYGLSENIIGYY
jgi:hypothetical protein